MKQKTLSYLFENIKDGDVLGFYSDKVGSKLIAFFTKARFDHVAIVYEIEKQDNVVKFYISEQSTSGGKYSKYVIVKTGDTFETSLKYQELYYGQLKKTLTPNGKKAGIEDAKNQVNKKYGFKKLILGMEGLEKALPKCIIKKIKNKRNGKNYARVCSSHVAINMVKNGSLSKQEYKQDFFYTPGEIFLLDEFDVFKI